MQSFTLVLAYWWQLDYYAPMREKQVIQAPELERGKSLSAKLAETVPGDNEIAEQYFGRIAGIAAGHPYDEVRALGAAGMSSHFRMWEIDDSAAKTVVRASRPVDAITPELQASALKNSRPETRLVAFKDDVLHLLVNHALRGSDIVVMCELETLIAPNAKILPTTATKPVSRLAEKPAVKPRLERWLSRRNEAQLQDLQTLMASIDPSMLHPVKSPLEKSVPITLNGFEPLIVWLSALSDGKIAGQLRAPVPRVATDTLRDIQTRHKLAPPQFYRQALHQELINTSFLERFTDSPLNFMQSELIRQHAFSTNAAASVALGVSASKVQQMWRDVNKNLRVDSRKQAYLVTERDDLWIPKATG